MFLSLMASVYEQAFALAQAELPSLKHSSVHWYMPRRGSAELACIRKHELALGWTPGDDGAVSPVGVREGLSPDVSVVAPVWLERRARSQQTSGLEQPQDALVISLPMDRMDSTTAEELEDTAKQMRKRARTLSMRVTTVRAVTHQPASAGVIFRKRVADIQEQEV